MRFFFSALALLSSAAGVVSSSATEQLRGAALDPDSPQAAYLGRSRELVGRIGKNSDWSDDVGGDCEGEVCAVFGDPHIISCDGLSYDCQAVGLFTLMENHMFTIQGHFTAVRVEDRFGHLKDIGGSLLNDAVIQFKSGSEGTHTPVLQLGFGDVTEAIDEFPSHVGCAKKRMYMPKRGRPICGDRGYEKEEDKLTRCALIGHRHKTTDVYKCREYCEATEGCAKFQFRYDVNGNKSKCELFKEDALPPIDQPGSWNLILAGDMEGEFSQCGVRQPESEFKSEQERLFHGSLGGNKNQKCPLLMHLDGELVDISHFNGQQKGYVVGNQDSDFFVKMNQQTLIVQYTTASGDKANVKLVQSGKGPGEKWNCHWHLHTCLPRSDQAIFNAYTGGAGLMGSPDGDSQNDWMKPDGTLIPISHGHQAAYDYCDDNWCVDRTDSLMVPPGDWTWDNIRCTHKEFKDIDISDPEACELAEEVIVEACKDTPHWLRYACELDCCVGGCEEIPYVIDDLTRQGDEPEHPEEDIQWDIPDHDECTVEDGSLRHTGDTVCPGVEGNVVSVLRAVGSDGSGNDLPGPNDIIYGLTLDIMPNENVTGKNLRFRVNNPFGSSVDVYVQHDKNADTDLEKILSPDCVPMIDTDSGCDLQAPKIEVACREYQNGESFALVHVHFSERNFVSDESVPNCCLADGRSDHTSAAGGDVIAYTFSIECGCPTVV